MNRVESGSKSSSLPTNPQVTEKIVESRSDVNRQPSNPKDVRDRNSDLAKDVPMPSKLSTYGTGPSIIWNSQGSQPMNESDLPEWAKAGSNNVTYSVLDRTAAGQQDMIDIFLYLMMY